MTRALAQFWRAITRGLCYFNIAPGDADRLHLWE